MPLVIEDKNILVWLKAMGRNQALPLDSSEIHDSLSAAETYASSSAIAYEGQTIKALGEDGKYHEYILQPSESGYTLEEVGAIKQEDLKQYVKVVSDIYTVSSPEEGVVYIQLTNTGNPDYDPSKPNADGNEVGYYYTAGGYIRNNGDWKQVFWLPKTAEDKLSELDTKISNKAPINNPTFQGTVKIGSDEVAVKSYVDGLIANLVSDVPGVLGGDNGLEIGDPHALKAGQTFRVAEAGTYFGHECEPGDLVILLKEYNGDLTDTSYDNDQAMVVQANVDGAVTSSVTATTVGEIVVFDAVTGKIIKGSGVQIASLNDAIAKVHEHSNKAKLDTYDKTQTELLAAAKTEAQSLVSAHETAVNTALDGKADNGTTLSDYGITNAYNKTEIDNKVTTITENLNTKASSSDVDTKIATAKTETLAEAATAASEALETRVGNIPVDTTIQSYIDTAIGSGGTSSAAAIATAKQEAINTAKSYTDTEVSKAITSANTYTDTKLSSALAIVEF